MFKEFSANIKKKKLIEAIEIAKKLYEQNNPTINQAKALNDKNIVIFFSSATQFPQTPQIPNLIEIQAHAYSLNPHLSQ